MSRMVADGFAVGNLAMCGASECLLSGSEIGFLDDGYCLKPAVDSSASSVNLTGHGRGITLRLPLYGNRYCGRDQSEAS